MRIFYTLLMVWSRVHRVGSTMCSLVGARASHRIARGERGQINLHTSDDVYLQVIKSLAISRHFACRLLRFVGSWWNEGEG